MRARSEAGQVTVLVLGLALVTFAVGGLAVDGTRAFLLRRTLQNAADGASLAAASEIDTTSYYESGGTRIELALGPARRTAERWLGLRGIRARVAIDVRPDSISIVLRSEMPTSFLGLVGVDRVPVAASARSEPVPGPP